jgi:hypothetical protein
VRETHMDTTFSRIKAHLAGWREWEMNPVLVKELRQAVRSRILTGALLVMLALLFATSLAAFVQQSYVRIKDEQIGLTICRVLLVILMGSTFLFIPLYVGFRLAAERQEHNFDLMFITTLAPGRIVRGKLFSGAYLTVMFFSVSMPFMTFTGLLRGVDLPTIFVILSCLYGFVCLAIQLAILLACLPVHQASKILTGLLFTAGLIFAGRLLMAFFFGLLRSGVGGGANFWIGFVILMALAAAGVQTLHVMSVSTLVLDNRPRGYFNEVIREEPS